MKYKNIREEELKNIIGDEYFYLHNCAKIIGNIDFSVHVHQDEASLLELRYLVWGEAKKGSSDIYASFVQLILTIGKARTFDNHLPPEFLAAFDGEKIAFVPYKDINDIFYLNDFNWNVTPSNHETKEFKIINDRIKNVINKDVRVYNYERDDKDLKDFIHKMAIGKYGQTKIKIDKNNFMVIYNKWLKDVRDTIAVNWELVKKQGIIDGDFYLADLLSQENKTLKEKLYVLLKTNYYELDRNINQAGMFESKQANFRDDQKAHHQFWNKYERPPKQEYWDYIVERRDLLVPQDVRERKGSFFTPGQWVELSQQYLADVLGEDWQDEYVVWDPAAGTGNLLAGLTNKYNLWASTLDKQDVEVMKDRIEHGANLLPKQVFQFDFLNDDFTKLPKALQNIINDPAKRKKLVIYINPPYAETMSYGKRSKKGLNISLVNNKYKLQLANASNRELFIQFLTRVYFEIPDCVLAEFSTIKALLAPHFIDFRKFFLAKMLACFVVPADTFDNVKGKFPVAFKIWDTSIKTLFNKFNADIYIKNSEEKIGHKLLICYDSTKTINSWLIETRKALNQNYLGFISHLGNDFQQNNVVFIMNDKKQMASPRGSWITDSNLTEVFIYFAVRHTIDATWLNNRDQFLYPNDGWQKDKEFQNDCLAYTLFHGQNNIKSYEGTNHWLPFTAQDVGAKGQFESTFMTDFIAGKLEPEKSTELFEKENHRTTPLKFSKEAKAVFSSGKELWIYYHKKSFDNINASFYDIRESFQGRNKKGRMNNKSNDEEYNKLIDDLRDKLKILAKKIEPKIYKYGFLKK